MAGAGGFSSSGADMARLMLFMLGRGELDGRRIVSEGTFAQFANVNAHRVHPCIQGLGFGIREDVNAAGLKASSPTNIIDAPDRPGIGHNGEGVGGKAHLAVFPHANMGIFIASNLSLAELPGVTTNASSTVESARFLIPQEDGVEAARDLERAAVLGFRGTVRARGGAFLPLGCPTTVGTRPKRARWQLPGDRLSSLASPLSGPLLSRGLRRNDSRRE
jgi:CubicO group peptidase (beta-lactamase class C family)